MKRRNTIKLLTLGTGAVFVTPLVSGLLSSCKSEPDYPSFEPEFFDAEELPLLNAVIDTLIPETDSPSAVTVGVPQTLDHMISGLYWPEQKAAFKANFSALKEYLNTVKGQSFINLKPEEKTTVLHELIDSREDSTKTARNSLLDIKNQSIAYYLNTEKVAKNHLNYLPVPGPFLPCVPLDELNGKAWAI